MVSLSNHQRRRPQTVQEIFQLDVGPGHTDRHHPLVVGAAHPLIQKIARFKPEGVSPAPGQMDDGLESRAAGFTGDVEARNRSGAGSQTFSHRMDAVDQLLHQRLHDGFSPLESMAPWNSLSLARQSLIRWGKSS